MKPFDDAETFSRRLKILFCVWLSGTLFLAGVGIYVLAHFVMKWW